MKRSFFITFVKGQSRDAGRVMHYTTEDGIHCDFEWGACVTNMYCILKMHKLTGSYKEEVQAEYDMVVFLRSQLEVGVFDDYEGPARIERYDSDSGKYLPIDLNIYIDRLDNELEYFIYDEPGDNCLERQPLKMYEATPAQQELVDELEGTIRSLEVKLRCLKAFAEGKSQPDIAAMISDILAEEGMDVFEGKGVYTY